MAGLQVQRLLVRPRMQLIAPWTPIAASSHEDAWNAAESSSPSLPAERRPDSATVGPGACIHIIEGPIAFIALQESPPCFARAWVGYLAREKLTDLTRLTALVRQLSRRLPMNVLLAQEITSALSNIEGVLGAAACLQQLRLSLRRGKTEPGDSSASFVWQGLYNLRPAFRREFMERCVCNSV